MASILQEPIQEREAQLRSIGRYIDAELKDENISNELLSLLPEATAVKYNVLPYQMQRDLSGKLQILVLAAETVAASLKIKHRLEKQLGIAVECCYSWEGNVIAGIEKHYGISMQRHRNLLPETTKKTSNAAEPDMEETSLVRKVNAILDAAIRRRVTDIDIHPEELENRVIFQIDGKRVEVSNEFPIPLHEKEAVVRRIKIMCEPQLEGSELMPQNGSFTFNGEDGTLTIDCRVGIMPTDYGEAVAIRLLDSGKSAMNVSELGFAIDDTKLLIRASKEAAGMFMVAGPTGSGKNTTLTAVLRTFDPDDFKIMTAEDPIEYRIEGAQQVQVRYAKEESKRLTFARILRNILRANPDIVMITEIRDEETAAIAIRGALTGHRLFSTVHARDVISAFPRLFDLGVDRRLVLETLSCVVAQRLLPLTCESCRTVYEPSEDDFAILLPAEREVVRSAASQGLLLHGTGCIKCQQLGVFKQIPVGEIVLMDAWLREYLLEPRGFQEIITTLRSRYKFRTMREKAFELVLQGRVSLPDFIEIVPKTEWSDDTWT